jgi:hypothetical protein
MIRLVDARTAESAPLPDPLVGACCSLEADDLRQRLAEWRALRDRATGIEPLEGGVRLTLSADERMDAVAQLVDAESRCCPFYRFTIRVEGPGRALSVEAGPTGAPAVRALLGLDETV